VKLFFFRKIQDWMLDDSHTNHHFANLYDTIKRLHCEIFFAGTCENKKQFFITISPSIFTKKKDR
jgi:hypothetical protein